MRARTGRTWTIEGGAQVVVASTTEELDRAAAQEAARVLRQAVAARGRANVMFATGNSQLGFVDELVHRTEGVPWGDLVVFHMDEYVGIAPDHPASFQRWIRERIVEPGQPPVAYYLEGRSSPEEACERYAGLLDAHPLDLCCLGIGENGHLAFNDPPTADFADPLVVKVVTLDEGCRRQQVGEGHFATVDDVPEQAITVTIPALLRAGRVLAMVPETRKQKAVLDALCGPVTTECPASVLQRTPQAAVYLDGDSAGLLPDDLAG